MDYFQIDLTGFYVSLAVFIIVVYCVALIYITVYCLLQFQLLYHYKRHHWTNTDQGTSNYFITHDFPPVTVQLPIYNELYVVGRLIDCVINFEYPKDKLEIQVLDDSTDETSAIIAEKVSHYRELGFDIQHIQRADRVGFKAGALKEATRLAKGEFIAIFDADFLPKKDFLLQTIPYFDHSGVGVVQTRWEHINQNYSFLTKLQAFQLNVHFTVEQSGRRAANYMLQFNGTAGVWRKKTIADSGGWEADTLTEDLDLSYRAQLKGWEIVYLEKIGSPAELPAEMNGLKSQQFRWMKGGAETAMKMVPAVWKSSMTVGKKIHATSHLMASGTFLFIFLSGVFSVPLLLALESLTFSSHYFGVFLAGLVSIIVIYYVANVQVLGQETSTFKKFFKFIFIFPLFLALSMGLSLHNSIAVLQGYIGKKSPFVRTPKFDIKDLGDGFKNRKYLAKKVSITTLFEGLLAIYFLGGIWLGFHLNNTSFVVFHALLCFGYGAIFYYSVRHLRFS